MKKNKHNFVGVLLAFFCFISMASAHHSFVADFDSKQVEKIKGTVSKMLPINPHPRIWVDVEHTDGSVVTWELQGGRGSADNLEVGQPVVVQGYMHRRQANSLYVDTLELENELIVDNADLGPGQEREGVEIAKNSVSYAEMAYEGGTRWPRDITGDWNQRYRGAISIDDLYPQPIPFTSEGKAVFDANQTFGKDPGLRCLNTGLARLFSGPSLMKIYEVGPKYIFLYALGERAHRTIHMDGLQPPADLGLSNFGYSTGRWENGTLIVETTHLKPMWLDVTGVESSGAETRVIERYNLSEDGSTMERTMTFHDPHFEVPLTRTRYASRSPNAPLTDGKGCDPDQFYRDLFVEDSLENYFEAKLNALTE